LTILISAGLHKSWAIALKFADGSRFWPSDQPYRSRHEFRDAFSGIEKFAVGTAYAVGGIGIRRGDGGHARARRKRVGPPADFLVLILAGIVGHKMVEA
jgi:hypothetical protein